MAAGYSSRVTSGLQFLTSSIGGQLLEHELGGCNAVYLLLNLYYCGRLPYNIESLGTFRLSVLAS
jgi:hypothetical protein